MTSIPIYLPTLKYHDPPPLLGSDLPALSSASWWGKLMGVSGVVPKRSFDQIHYTQNTCWELRVDWRTQKGNFVSSRDKLTQARAGAATRRSGKRAGESWAGHTAVRPGVSLHEPQGWRRPIAVKAPDFLPRETRMPETLGEIYPPPSGASDRIGFTVYLTDIF